MTIPIMIPCARIALAAAVAYGGVVTSQEQSMSSRQAAGSFTVTIRPPSRAERSATFVRVQIDKVFEGGLVGTSELEMLASNAGDQGSGGYVALERFTGTLDGRRGSFIMQHSGTMSPQGTHIDIQVSPGSGTDALAGIRGALTIRIEGKQHFYTLTYTLPNK